MTKKEEDLDTDIFDEPKDVRKFKKGCLLVVLGIGIIFIFLPSPILLIGFLPFIYGGATILESFFDNRS